MKLKRGECEGERRRKIVREQRKLLPVLRLLLQGHPHVVMNHASHDRDDDDDAHATRATTKKKKGKMARAEGKGRKNAQHHRHCEKKRTCRDHEQRRKREA